jgi:hypothetical protein
MFQIDISQQKEEALEALYKFAMLSYRPKDEQNFKLISHRDLVSIFLILRNKIQSTCLFGCIIVILSFSEKKLTI